MTPEGEHFQNTNISPLAAENIIDNDGKDCIMMLNMGNKETITIKEAAKLLGVSEMTLRRWDNAKRFKARRHPINRFRLYEKSEVLSLKKKIEGK